ncbi:MAG: 3-hydroxyacyl-ACP dehydratase FabZ [Desulfobacterales bacterium]|nr:3-hydroxyacyl-ACP dehydratase FabZ [Desulfobacterales bacterium]
MDPLYDVQKIMEFLPHRYPFLLVDRVLELTPGKKIVAMKNVTMNEPFFQGHFPGLPIMPGVLIIEAMAQAGGVLAQVSAGAEEKGGMIYFMAMDKVRFRKMVTPGDQLIFELTVINFRKKVAKMAGKALVDGELAAEAQLMAGFGEKI